MPPIKKDNTRIQLLLPTPLAGRIDAVCAKRNITRTAFMREAVEVYLRNLPRRKERT